jgi:GntR family transcriptional regulator
MAPMPITALDRTNITSLYQQIATRLREEAMNGAYGASGKLPSEAQLCERFGVSRITVRQALDRLEEDGTVERKQGKGTYVAGKRVRHGLDALRSFHDSLVLQGLTPEMRLLSLEPAAVPEHLRGRFVDADDGCVLLRRLHLVDGKPIALGASYLPRALEGLDAASVARQPNYALLGALNGKGVAHADIAIRAEAANSDVARILKVKKGSPLLVMTRTSAFSNGDCCDHSTFHICPDRYEFFASCTFQLGE